MKTPDEIKKALECCAEIGVCSECHYYNKLKFGGECVEIKSIDALNYIRQLENHIGELTEKVTQLEAAQPKWISVDERLPEKHGQHCVCLFNQHGADKSILFPYVFTWYAYGHNGYVNGPHFSDEGLDGLKVYYWMPLPSMPEPPKEEA